MVAGVGYEERAVDTDGQALGSTQGCVGGETAIAAIASRAGAGDSGDQPRLGIDAADPAPLALDDEQVAVYVCGETSGRQQRGTDGGTAVRA